MSTTWWSFTPRRTTMLIFTGASPASAAASMPSSTFATGKSASFMARKVASSSESRLTVTRSRPAALSARALAFSAEPLVVSVRSVPGTASRSMATRRSMSFLSSGSPPVRRIFSVPRPRKMRAMRTISSKVRISACGRNS